MGNFNEIIDFVARTNLFNFVIFLSIIIFLLKKLDLSQKLDKMVEDVNQTIENSEEAKTESQKQLSSIEESMNNLDTEINAIFEKSEENALLVGSKVLEDANKQALIIKDNSEKTIENNLQLLKNDLIRRASLASIEVAKSHIIEELNNNSELHDKLIDESIDSIEIVNIEGVEK